MSLRRLVLPLACAGVISFGVGCRGPDETLDCSDRAEQFEAAASAEGQLLSEIPEKASYPMALVISEEGIDRLLTGVVGNKLPFATDLPLVGLGIARFSAISDPSIEFIDVPGCSRCVVIGFEFGVSILNTEQEEQAGGIGRTELSIPLELRTVEGDTTALVAIYDKLTVRDLSFSAAGYQTEKLPNFEAALEIKVTEFLRESYGPTELLRFEPWSIGSDAVKLAAKNFLISPTSFDPDTNARVPGFISLGLQTNLALPEGVAIEVGRSLPDGVPMAVQMHPGLLLGMSERMLAEGVISRSYDEKGQPDPSGLYGVTLERLEKSTIGGTDIDVGFRVWRTDEGYCGFADAETTLELSLVDEGLTDRIAVTPTGELRVTGGEGVGELAATNEEFVDQNKGLVDNFQRDLSEQIGLTVNYSQLEVEGANLYFDALSLTLEPERLNIFLDFLILEQEEGA